MPFWRGFFELGLGIQSLAGFWMLAIVCYSGLRLTKLESLPSVHGAAYFKAGQLIVCVVGAVAILYNWLPLFGCIFGRLHAPPTFAAIRRRNIYIQLWILGSLVLTVGLCIGVRIQITALPADCDQARMSPLLNQVGSIISTDQKFPAVAACQTFTDAWHFTLPLIVLSGLTIVSGVLSFLEVQPTGRWPNWRPNITIPWPAWMVTMTSAALSPLRFVWRCWCRSWPLALALSLFTVLLPFIMPLIWVVEMVKHFDKRWNKDKPASEDSSFQIDIDLEVFNSQPIEAMTSCPLEKALTVDDFFFSLAEFMHGRDLHALACVSKSANAIIKRHWKHNKGFLSKHLCRQAGKRCYYCSIPVCTKCKGLQYIIQQTTKEMQRRTLQVMCSVCYISELHSLNHFNSLDQKCAGNHHDNIFTDEDNNRTVWICRKCSPKITGKDKDDIEKAEEMREKFAKLSGLELNAYNHHQCFACDRKIWRTSLRWWRCTECGLECRDKKL